MLKGKNAVITGARRGIGRATVEVFARYGANVWACARTQDNAFESDMAALSEQYGVWIKPVYFDLSDDAGMKKAVQGILKEKKPIDILVNNAGIVTEAASFLMTGAEKMRDTFEINFFAASQFTQYICRAMARRKSGSVVFVSSAAALDGYPGEYAYSASKAALIGAVKYLAGELGQYHIRVNAVAPSMTDTDMKNGADPAYWNQLVERTVMKRMARPEEISNVIAFLSGDLASYVNGQILKVDGGGYDGTKYGLSFGGYGEENASAGAENGA